MVGWDKTKNNYSKVLGVFLIFIVLCLSNNFLNRFTFENSDYSIIILSFFMHLAFIILGFILGINVIKQGLIVVRGGEANLRALLDYPVEFWKYIGGQILTCLAIVAGLICLIIPGIIIAIRLMFMKQVLVDQNLGPVESIVKSFAMTRGQTKNLFFFIIGLLIFNLAGLLVFIVGLAVTIPISFFAILHLYDTFAKQS